MQKCETTIYILFAICSLITSVYAFDFEVDGIYYNCDVYYQTASVTYLTISYNSYRGSIAIPDEVEYDGVIYTVTSIGNHAFEG